MPDPLAITVLPAGRARRTQHDAIDQIRTRAQATGQPLRVRIPVEIYNPLGPSRTYSGIPEASWTLRIPSDQVTTEQIQELIRVIGVCLAAVATHGSERIEALLVNAVVGGEGG